MSNLVAKDDAFALIPEWVDAVADQFEAAWQNVIPPSIASFLGDETDERRAILLAELIRMDIACRAKLGQRRQLADYLQEFPELRGPSASLHPTPVGAPHTENQTPPALPPASATAWPLIPGYDILDELGRGGMGVVYKARQERPDRLVALKMVLAGAHAGSQEVARFRGEAEKTARLQHPHIVQVFEVNEHEGRPYFSLEYVAGGSLAQKLNGTPQPARQAAELVETLSRAIHAAHQAGVIHRDLKPSNVLLTADGTPKITDFGLAKRLDAETQQTPSGAVIGTPSYMAPEQALGKTTEIGPAVDVYALGAILYEMLTGRPPFKGETLWDTVQQVIAEDPVPPRRLQPKVPRDLETICLRHWPNHPPSAMPRQVRWPTTCAASSTASRFKRGRLAGWRHSGVGVVAIRPWRA
jgi:serine/threonine protein kinase